MKSLQRILIAGGGSSGWMTAALLARMFQGLYEVVLVESEDIGTIGVGEATIPAIKKYNELLGLEENEFMARTQGTGVLAPALANEGLVRYDWNPAVSDGKAEGGVTYPIADFYLTNAICRASPTMQRCSAELVHGQDFAEAAE